MKNILYSNRFPDILVNQEMKNFTFKKGKLGLLFWFFSCFSGSVIVVEIERFLFNKILGFHMPLSNGIKLWFLVTFFILIISSPLVLIIYFLLKRNKTMIKVMVIGLSVAFMLSYLVTLSLSLSYFEAFYITAPYFFFAFLFGYLYLKIEKSN